MKTTRDIDLGALEEGRDTRRYEHNHAKKILNQVYRQAKDSTLESMRRALLNAHRRDDKQEIYKLERLIDEYGRQHHF